MKDDVLFVITKDNKLIKSSDAVIYILKKMKFPYKIAVMFAIIPRKYRDYVNTFIAKNRQKFFKRNYCIIPAETKKTKILP